MILPGEQIGVLGGGQLGMFFTAAAQQMGYRVVVWDPDPNAPARLSADQFISAPFNDQNAFLSFIKETKGVTYEWENIPAEIASKIEERITVYPGSAVLRLLQNRATQKKFLTEQNLPVAPYHTFLDPSTFSEKV
jgi:5-(carboxyamino)imidazole ribonucleotide synthase